MAVKQTKRPHAEVEAIVRQFAMELMETDGPIQMKAWAEEHGISPAVLHRNFHRLYPDKTITRGYRGIEWAVEKPTPTQNGIAASNPDPEIELVHDSKDFIVFKYRGKAWGARPI